MCKEIIDYQWDNSEKPIIGYILSTEDGNYQGVLRNILNFVIYNFVDNDYNVVKNNMFEKMNKMGFKNIKIK